MSSYIPRSLLDQARPETADPTYRMSMMPFATYPNADSSGEHLGLAVPGMIEEPMNALMRLIGTPSKPGTFTQGPDYGSNAEDMRTLLEAFMGGNAVNPATAVSEGSIAANPNLLSRLKSWFDPNAEDRLLLQQTMRDHVYPSANSKPYSAPIEGVSDISGKVNLERGYRGLAEPFDPSRNRDVFWGSNNPEVAADYTGMADTDWARPNIMPVDLHFSNPLHISPDEPVNWKNIPFEGQYLSTDDLARLATDRGHDGLIVSNVVDGLANSRPATSFAALKRGTVTSPLTGETLFSDNLPSLPGAVVAGAERNTPIRAYRGTLNPDNIARENAATLWGSASPDVASTYARTPYGDGPTGSVAPVDLNFQNPLVVDAGGNSWMNIPHDGSTINADSLAFRARADGHDGLVIRNVMDAANRMKDEPVLVPSTTYAALKRGTVTSPLTGETLFSNGLPSLWGAAVQGQQTQPYPNSLFTY